LIGRDAMSGAYRTLYSMKPPYGQPLSSDCKQVFVDQAPAAVKTQVASIVANITYRRRLGTSRSRETASKSDARLWHRGMRCAARIPPLVGARAITRALAVATDADIAN